MVQHTVKGRGDRVRHVLCDAISVEAHLAGDFLASALQLVLARPHHTPRNPHDRRAVRHVLEYYRIGANTSAYSNNHGTQDLGPGPDHHIIAQSRMALAPFPASTAQGHAVIQ